MLKITKDRHLEETMKKSPVLSRLEARAYRSERAFHRAVEISKYSKGSQLRKFVKSSSKPSGVSK